MPLLFTCAVGFLRWREDAKLAFTALTFLVLLTAYHLNAWCESWLLTEFTATFSWLSAVGFATVQLKWSLVVRIPQLTNLPIWFFTGRYGDLLFGIHFGDLACILSSLGFTIVIYADDYNAFKTYHSMTHNRLIMNELHEFQRELHAWGKGNQIVFDDGK